MTAALPQHEAARLSALARYAILNTPPETSLDEIVLLAAQIGQAPVALLSFIDAEQQWVKARFGFAQEIIPRSQSFCAQTIVQDTPLIITDVRQDEYFRAALLDNCLRDIRFYAGVPLLTPDGYAVGTLCVMDRFPRTLAPRARQALVLLGRQVMHQLEMRRAAQEIYTAYGAWQQREEELTAQHDALHRVWQQREEELTADGQQREEELTAQHNALYADGQQREEELTVQRDALAARESYYRTLFEENPGALYVHDPEGYIVSVNPSAATLLGYAPSELAGHNLKEFLAPAWRRHAKNDAYQQGLARVVTKDGETRLVRYKGAPLQRPDEATLIASSLTDITQARAQNRALRLAHNAANAKLRGTSKFLANMSHEIRTPMNGIVGMANLLADSELNHAQREYVELLRDGSDNLITFINDILDLSKIEAGMMSLEKVDFDLHGVVENAVKIFAGRAHAKGLEMVTQIENDVPRLLRGDPGRLRQVLNNLVSNAVKFTQQGEIVVTVAASAVAGERVQLQVSVRDTGIGIPADFLPRLYDSYTQASQTWRYGGTGLGLAITKQLVEMMSGHISVESEVGQGSTFRFTVEMEAQPSIVAHITPPGDLRGLRVLVVDDNAASRHILRQQTTSWGMTPREAESATAALDELRRAVSEDRPFDVAIVDWEMPDMDGIELARRIKEETALSALPLILLSSFGWRGQAKAARAAGLSAYLTKPIRQSQLFECLVTVLGLYATHDLAPAGLLVTRHNLKDYTPLDKIYRLLLAEDNIVNQQVAVHQLYKLGYTADVVNNGREALAALAQHNYDLVLLDCQMPEMDGYQAAAEIRRREKDGPRHTAIVAMTAHALPGDREQCLAAGMDDYLQKPIKTPELQEMLTRWLTPAVSQEEVTPVSLTVTEALTETKAAPTPEISPDTTTEEVETLEVTPAEETPALEAAPTVSVTEAVAEAVPETPVLEPEPVEPEPDTPEAPEQVSTQSDSDGPATEPADLAPPAQVSTQSDSDGLETKLADLEPPSATPHLALETVETEPDTSEMPDAQPEIVETPPDLVEVSVAEPEIVETEPEMFEAEPDTSETPSPEPETADDEPDTTEIPTSEPEIVEPETDTPETEKAEPATMEAAPEAAEIPATESKIVEPEPDTAEVPIAEPETGENEQSPPEVEPEITEAPSLQQEIADAAPMADDAPEKPFSEPETVEAEPDTSEAPTLEPELAEVVAEAVAAPVVEAVEASAPAPERVEAEPETTEMTDDAPDVSETPAPEPATVEVEPEAPGVVPKVSNEEITKESARLTTTPTIAETPFAFGLRAPSAWAESPIDLSVLARLLSRDGKLRPDLAVELIDLFLQDAAKHTATLRQAWPRRDTRALLQAVHSLKSSSASMGAKRLSLLCDNFHRQVSFQQYDFAALVWADLGTELEQVCQALRVERHRLATA